MQELEQLAYNYCKIHYADLDGAEFEARYEAAQFDISRILALINLFLGMGDKLDREELSALILSVVEMIWGQDAPEFVQLIVAILPLLLGFVFQERE